MTKGLVFSLFLLIGFATITFGEVLLTGTPKLACEAILCLSSGTRPGECSPSLNAYFGINYKYWSDTVRARRNFLSQCPTVSSSNDQQMSTLITAISNGAGRCDAAFLNQYLRMNFFKNGPDAIDNKLPNYCKIYSDHEYTDYSKPVYIGTPECGGHWVDAQDYESELAKYKASNHCHPYMTRWN